jgi:aspartyl-tRNA(Asn)/glutamyl-tRNA(Gln) amidotransferase subunit A
MHIGPLARTVADVALTLSAIMGPDPADPFSYAASGAGRIAAAAQPRNLRGIRCAWMPKVGNAGLDPDTATATRAAAEDLQRSGAVIDEVACDLRESADLIFAITPPLFYALYGSKLDQYRDKLDPTCRAVIEAGKDLKAEAYQKALMRRTAFFRRVQALFDTYDFLLMPTLSAPALSADHKAFDELTIGNIASGSPRYAWYPYTHPFNMTGHPAISIPVGWSGQGLPIGLQIVGPWHAEERLLGIAASLEAMRPFADRRPPL